MKTPTEQIRKILDQKPKNTIISMHNQKDGIDFGGSLILDLNKENVETYFSTPWEAVRAFMYGDAKMNDDYFTFDGNANVVTFTSLSEENSPIDLDDLADWLADDESLWPEYNLNVTKETSYEPLDFFSTFHKDIEYSKTPFIEAIIEEYTGTVEVNAEGEYIVDGDAHGTYTVDDFLEDYVEYIDEDILSALIKTHWDLNQLGAREESDIFFAP